MFKLTEAEKKAIQDEVAKEMAAAVEFAEKSPQATLPSALEDVYA